MKAVHITKFGGPEVLAIADVPVPEPGPDEVLIKVEAAGVNFSDTNWRDGKRGGTPPFIDGSEAAGTVAAIGADAHGFEVGERVAFWNPGLGCYAEYGVCPAFRVVRLPDDMDFGTGAALMLQGLTAHYLVRSTYAVKEGDAVLFHAGAGGVGQIAIQLVKSRGGRIFATVGSPEKADFVREIGADGAILYLETDFAEAVRELTGGEGVQAAYDSVGADTWEGSIKSLARRGHVVYFGGASGPVPQFDTNILTRNGSLTMSRTTLKDHVADRPEIEWRTGELFDLWRKGGLKIKVGHTYPLADAARAHRDLEGRKTSGKIILLP